jgi:hypothetical protein
MNILDLNTWINPSFLLITDELGHSNVFICFASFENPKTYQPAREKNKQEKITKFMQIF